LLDEAVVEYIRKEHLYKGEKAERSRAATKLVRIRRRK
jgi:hypothetical protein